jgi:hypothetical protein
VLIRTYITTRLRTVLMPRLTDRHLCKIVQLSSCKTSTPVPGRAFIRPSGPRSHSRPVATSNLVRFRPPRPQSSAGPGVDESTRRQRLACGPRVSADPKSSL